MKKCSDEQLVLSLMQHGTIRDASAACGLSERGFRERMKSADFIELYQSAKADILRLASCKLGGALAEAVEVCRGIMSNDDVNPAVRLSAARVILDNAARFSEISRTAERRVRLDTSEAHEREFDERCGLSF